MRLARCGFRCQVPSSRTSNRIFSVPGPETKRYPHTRTHGTDCLGARNEHPEQHGAADKRKVVVDGFGEVA
jgi:hypothetical protein